MNVLGSKEVARVAIQLSLSRTRDEERELKNLYLSKGIRTAAVDFGGEFLSSIAKIVERAVVASKREGVIAECHVEEGAVAGACREAISQVINKAAGLNVGGKIGVARDDNHVSVAIFFGIGLLHLNEVAVGLGHRAV